MLDVVHTNVEYNELENSKYFSLFGEQVISILFNTKLTKVFNKGDVISTGEKNPNSILFIKSGQAKSLVYLMDGREFVIDTKGPGSVVGEVQFLSRFRTQFEVHAITTCEIWIIDGCVIKRAIEENLETAKNILDYMFLRIQELENRLVCLTSASISTRLANALIRLSTGNQCEPIKTIAISQHVLASMLPASREKVNRCLREWERNRIIALAPGTITIKNTRALHEYAIS